MRQRVARSRELVAAGDPPSVVARVAQVSRQALYRSPKPRTPPQRRPPADPVEAAIIEEALANQTDGYRMVTAFVRRRLARPVNRKRVLRVLREQRLIQRRRPLERKKRPGFFRVERPRQLWQLDMTSVWVAEHGWTYLMAIIDCCTRAIVAWQLELRCRADEAIAAQPGQHDLQLLLRRPAPILPLLAQPRLLLGRAAHPEPAAGQSLRRYAPPGLPGETTPSGCQRGTGERGKR